MAESIFDLAQWKLWARTEISEDDNLNASAGQSAASMLGRWAERDLTWIDAATATATARPFRPWGPGTTILPIDDAAVITSVTESGSVLTSDVNYIAEPYGNRNGAGQWRPFDHLIRIDACWYIDGVRRTVIVTAKWGWTSLPPEAIEAVKVLAQDWSMNRNSAFGFGGINEQGFSTGMRDNPMVKQAINAIRGAKASPFGG